MGSATANFYSSNRILFWLAFFSHLFLCFYFVDKGNGANQRARMALGFSLASEGTLAVDRYESLLTVDKASINGKVYSDKPPLISFLSVPLVKGLFAFYPDFGSKPLGKQLDAGARLSAFIFSAIPFALILAFLTSWLCSRNPDPTIPLWISLVFYSSFPVTYANVFFSHSFTSLLLILAFFSSFVWNRPLTSGLLLGCAFMAEYQVLFTFPLWLLYLFLESRKTSSSFWRVGIRFILGLVPWILCGAFYNYLTTGLPWRFAYYYNNTYPMMKNANGFLTPNFERFFQLCFGKERGMFLYAPMALLFFGNLIRSFGLRGIFRRPEVGILTLMTLIMSAFIGFGGACYGPRYLGPALMLFFTVILFERGKEFLRPYWLSILLGTGGFVLVMMDLFTVGIWVPETGFPITRAFLPALYEGRLTSNAVTTQLFGMSPLWACFTWAIAFVLCHFALYRHVSTQIPHRD